MNMAGKLAVFGKWLGLDDKTLSKPDTTPASLWIYVKICALSTFIIRKIVMLTENSGQNGTSVDTISRTKEILDEIDSMWRLLEIAMSDEVPGFKEAVDPYFLNNLKQSKDLMSAIKDLERAVLKETQNENQKLANENKRLLEKNPVQNRTGLETVKDNGKRLPSLKATLHIQNKGDISDRVANEIQNMLKVQVSTLGYDVQLSKCDDAKKIDPRNRHPVIVVCFNSSRLGTDMNGALKDIKKGPKIAVLILHHKEMHAQPSQSSDRVLTSEEFKELGGIFDMAFTSSQGIYQCDLNNRAVMNLAEFVKKTH